MNVLIELAAVFLRLGLLAFGGSTAILPEMERQVVEQHAWLTRTQFLDGFAFGGSYAEPGAADGYFRGVSRRRRNGCDRRSSGHNSSDDTTCRTCYNAMACPATLPMAGSAAARSRRRCSRPYCGWRVRDIAPGDRGRGYVSGRRYRLCDALAIPP